MQPRYFILLCLLPQIDSSPHPDLLFHLQSMIGHCLGAAGGLEAIATIKAINTGWVHPSINQFVSVGLPRLVNLASKH
jgi:hypothetical protein